MVGWLGVHGSTTLVITRSPRHLIPFRFRTETTLVEQGVDTLIEIVEMGKMSRALPNRPRGHPQSPRYLHLHIASVKLTCKPTPRQQPQVSLPCADLDQPHQSSRCVFSTQASGERRHISPPSSHEPWGRSPSFGRWKRFLEMSFVRLAPAFPPLRWERNQRLVSGGAALPQRSSLLGFGVETWIWFSGVGMFESRATVGEEAGW
jgi:hypothetical protein